MTDFDMTPEQASHGRVIPDADLPMLAAQWMVSGHETPALIELAGLSRNDATEARRLFPTVLEELGHPIRDSMSPYEELPWRGQWEGIRWAVDRMDVTHAPYASAQCVLEIIGDTEALWEPGGGEELMVLLREWDSGAEGRDEVNERIRQHLRSLQERDVPPLVAREQH